MPFVAFDPSTGTGLTETEITETKMRRAFRRIQGGGTSVLETSLARAGRRRAPGDLLICDLNGSLELNFKRKTKFSPLLGNAKTETSVQYFLNATPAAPPIGNLQLPSVNSLLNPQFVAPAFSGSKHTRGDQVVVKFVARGQRLNGLIPEFHACRTDEPVGSPHDLVKTGTAINITDPVRDTMTMVETLTGSFYIHPNDTATLPEGETEFVYEFKLSDGLGRTFTLETGKFRFRSNC
jgi:hypothetical protein